MKTSLRNKRIGVIVGLVIILVGLGIVIIKKVNIRIDKVVSIRIEYIEHISFDNEDKKIYEIKDIRQLQTMIESINKKIYIRDLFAKDMHEIPSKSLTIRVTEDNKYTVIQLFSDGTLTVNEQSYRICVFNNKQCIVSWIDELSTLME